MNFILGILAVVIGMYVYNFLQGVFYEIKIGRTNKRLLRWKKECEDNILAGRQVEQNKVTLKTINASIDELHKTYIKKANNQ